MRSAMFKPFYPDKWVDSTYNIDFEDLYKQGYRGIIFDIDNTLVPHGAPADERAVELFDRLRAIGFESILLSNNDEARVDMFNKDVHTHTLCHAHKPSKKGYLAAMQIMNTTKETTLTIGDQLFTDMWGAYKAGIYKILVKPIHPKEEIQIVLKRILEKLVLARYKRKQRIQRLRQRKQ